MIAQLQIPLQGLGISLWLMATGDVVVTPLPFFIPTYEHVPEGVTYWIDKQGLILSEKGSKEYEYDFGYMYKYKQEPLLKGWLYQLQLEMPEEMKKESK